MPGMSVSLSKCFFTPRADSNIVPYQPIGNKLMNPHLRALPSACADWFIR